MSDTEQIVGLGARGDYVAPVPNVDPSRLRLTPDEARLFSGIGRVSRIADVLARSGLEESRAIAVLLALRAKGAIVPARLREPPSGPQPVVDAASSEEVDLTPERKQEILELERKLETANPFELFGLPPGAPPSTVKSAYYEASRKFHPDRYYGKNLGSFRGRIDRIFRALTEAEKTLTEEKRRAEFLAKNPHLNAPAPVEPVREVDPEREAERRSRLSRHPYLMKNSRVNELVAKAKKHIDGGEPGLALSDLHLVLQMDSRHKDALALQAVARRLHEQGRAKAELTRGEQLERAGDLNGAANAYRLAAGLDPNSASAAFKAAQSMLRSGQDPKEARHYAQRAVELDARNADHQALLGQIFKEAGMDKLAQRHFEEALKLAPNHPEAKKHIKKGRWPFSGS